MSSTRLRTKVKADRPHICTPRDTPLREASRSRAATEVENWSAPWANASDQHPSITRAIVRELAAFVFGASACPTAKGGKDLVSPLALRTAAAEVCACGAPPQTSFQSSPSSAIAASTPLATLPGAGAERLTEMSFQSSSLSGLCGGRAPPPSSKFQSSSLPESVMPALCCCNKPDTKLEQLSPNSCNSHEVAPRTLQGASGRRVLVCANTQVRTRGMSTIIPHRCIILNARSRRMCSKVAWQKGAPIAKCRLQCMKMRDPKELRHKSSMNSRT